MCGNLQTRCSVSGPQDELSWIRIPRCGFRVAGIGGSGPSLRRCLSDQGSGGDPRQSSNFPRRWPIRGGLCHSCFLRCSEKNPPGRMHGGLPARGGSDAVEAGRGWLMDSYEEYSKKFSGGRGFVDVGGCSR